jgi:UDP-N-acetyl-D-glucosamine dehydrogenase
MAVLKDKGARLSYHDPYVPKLAARDWPGAVDMTSTPVSADSVAGADCVVIITDHKAFDYPAIQRQAKLLVDTRNAVKGTFPNVFKLGAPPRAGF